MITHSQLHKRSVEISKADAKALPLENYFEAENTHLKLGNMNAVVVKFMLRDQSKETINLFVKV